MKSLLKKPIGPSFEPPRPMSKVVFFLFTLVICYGVWFTYHLQIKAGGEIWTPRFFVRLILLACAEYFIFYRTFLSR